MKNAFVLVAHAGDRGRQEEGDIILDLSNQRFEDLEKVNLIRSATTDEVKNWKPRFEAEADETPARTIVVDVADLQSLRDRVTEHTDMIIVITGERDEAIRQLGELRPQLESATSEMERLASALAEALELNKQHEETIVKLTEARDQALAARPADSTAPAGGEKQAVEPDNKQAQEPSNKQAAAAKPKA